MVEILCAFVGKILTLQIAENVRHEKRSCQSAVVLLECMVERGESTTTG